jgi:hypothetical protein
MIKSVISKLRQTLEVKKEKDTKMSKKSYGQSIKEEKLPFNIIFKNNKFFSFPLNKVGVKEKFKDLVIQDIFGRNKNKKIRADLEVSFYLPSFKRKLSVDFIEKAGTFLDKVGLKIETYAEKFLEYLKEMEPSLKSEFKIKFKYERLIKKRCFIKPLKENFKIYFISRLEDKKSLNSYGLGVDFIFNCHSFFKEILRDFSYFSKENNISDDISNKLISNYLGLGHFKVGKLFLMIEDLNNNLSFKDLYKVVNNSVFILRKTYHSKDEFELLKQILNQNFLLEDISRKIVANIFFMLKDKLHPKSKIKINLNSGENIHTQNFKVNISINFEKILKYINFEIEKELNFN